MSQENVELVRRGLASVDAFWAMLDEYVVWDLRELPMLDLDGVYVGRDAVVKASRHYWGTWRDYRLDAEELLDAGSSVVVVLRERGRGRGSGAPFDQRFAQVWTFSRGRIVRWELFQDSTRALEAVGLSESSRFQENVEIVKAAYDAFNREDWDAVFKDAAPGCETDFSRAVGPWRGVFGLDQIRRVVEEFGETWESARWEPHEFIEAGDLVVVPGTQHVKGRGGIEVVARGAFVWTIRNGAIERVSMYQERQDALEALGLSEHDAHADS